MTRHLVASALFAGLAAGVLATLLQLWLVVPLILVPVLVLGRRGRGGLAHLVLGSTTTALIRQPDCPIAVIPPEETHD